MGEKLRNLIFNFILNNWLVKVYTYQFCVDIFYRKYRKYKETIT